MKALIIGMGNDYRSDDGVGRVVARRLRAESLDEVGILEETVEGAALIEAWRGADFVILVDAVHSGASLAPSTASMRRRRKSRAVFFTTRRTLSAFLKLLK